METENVPPQIDTLQNAINSQKTKLGGLVRSPQREKVSQIISSFVLVIYCSRHLPANLFSLVLPLHFQNLRSIECVY
jgi:hypothetical protein